MRSLLLAVTSLTQPQCQPNKFIQKWAVQKWTVL